MSNLECGPLKLSGCDKSLRSISEQNGFHCLDKPDSIGEPIAAVDIPAYFKRLRASRVDQWNALRIAFDCNERVNNKDIPIAERRITAEAIQAAVQVLPKKLAPVEITVFRGRK